MEQNKRKENEAIKAGIGYTIGNYLIKGLSFLTIPIFARLLNSSDYGRYNTYMAFEAIIYIFIGLALHTSFKKAKYKFKNYFDQYVSSCMVLSIISFFFFLLLAIITYPLLKEMWGFERTLIILLFVHSLGSALIQFYNAYASLYYAYVKFLKLSIFNALINIFLSIVFIFMFSEGEKYKGRILGTSLPVILVGFYIIHYFFQKQKPKVNFLYLKYGLTYSLPIIPHGLSQIVLSQFDRIMINRMIGASEAGIYSFGYNIYTIIQVTSNSLSNVWEPWFFEKIEKNDINTIRKVGQVFAIFMLGFSAVLVLLAPELIMILGTDKYADSVYCVPSIVMGGYFSFLYILPCEVEYYYEKTSNIGVATCLAAGINFLLNYICIKQFGYVSAAYTTLVTYFLYFLFHYIMARKIQGFFLYSNKMILFIVVLAFFICFAGVFLISYIIIRVMLAILTITLLYGYVKKTINISQIIKRKARIGNEKQ